MPRSVVVKVAVCAALSVLALALALPGAAAPAVVSFSVTSRLDDIDDNPGNGACHTSAIGPAAGLCTLRAAVMEANHTSGPGAVINLPSGIYTLTISATGAQVETSGDLDLITPTVGSPLISIVGAGAASTIIDANQLDRVFYVHNGRHAAISGLTLRNGYAPSGGGLYNEGTLTVTDSLFSRNSASNDGGGFFNFGTLSLNQSTLSQNSAFGGGGAYNYGILSVNRSTISGNTASNSGAGIFAFEDLFLSNSTLSGNSTNGDGGGIYNYGHTLNVFNTSILSNEADADADNLGSGAGVYSLNTPSSIFNQRNTLLAGNYLSGAPIYDECSGQLHSYGNNLIGLAGQGGLCSITQVGAGAWTSLNSPYLIGPLQNNGGPTLTQALLRGSNAIDGGDPTLGCIDQNGIILTDQRGAARVIGALCDIGAFEYRPPLSLPYIRR